uniref:Autophagy-related protein 9 n=2 Tax=Brachionus plicatilis TaxID=10195 RepID=A0A2Z4EUQ7_BRAPC|nr:autophagy-related protein 9 [Brachionus plicatilis]
MSTSVHQYRGLNAQSTDNEEEDYPPQLTTLTHEIGKSKWSHIDDLDEFFARVYHYHQNHGMPSLILTEFLNLFQIVFLAFFSVFMLECVNYNFLFQSQHVISDKKNNSFVEKRSLHDVIYPLNQCVNNVDFKIWFSIVIVFIFWVFRLIKAIYNIARYAEIRSFYISALNIHTNDLPNITWNEVLEKLLQMQKKHHLCIHKQELTELDIYNRILRFRNYLVAMVNQGILPPKIDVPIFGQLVLLTTGFKYNFEFLFFWGPFAPFQNCYQLRHEYKVYSKRAELTAELSKSILLLGILNLILSPVIFVWQLLQFLYNYTDLIKRDPSVLGSRRWSNYGRLYFRHFNELDHELDARLSKAYRPAMNYLSSFVSKFLSVLAKFFVLTCGTIFAVLVLLTIYDEDVINIEHLLTIISVTGAIAGIARSLIPDENFVFFTDQMMFQVLAHVHYMPDSWKEHANSYIVRDEFVKLFQYKFVYLLEELLSPIITPFILIFWLRPRAVNLVDFLRNFTVDVVGVGDVCSFAQMDTKRHGNPRWLSKANPKKSHQARNGKTELSLIHFVHTNPKWKLPAESIAFIDQLKDQAIRESSTIEQSITKSINDPKTTDSITEQKMEQSLTKSIYHLQSLVYSPNLPSNLIKSSINSQPQYDFQMQSFGQMPRGGVSRIEGPLFTNKQQTLLSIAQASTLQLSSQGLPLMPGPNITTALENSLDMCFSALYIHELHRKYHHGDYIDLDNVKEENDDDTDGDNLFEMNQKRPLLKSGGKRGPHSQEIESESEEDNSHNLTMTSYNDNTYLTTNRGNGLKLSHNQNQTNNFNSNSLNL